MEENEIGRLTIMLQAQMGEVYASFQSLEKTVAGLAEKSETHFQKMSSQWLKTAGGFVLGQLGISSIQQAFTKLTSAISDSMKAFDDEIVMLTQINSMLGSGAEELARYGQKRQEVTRYSHDEYIEASRLLATHKLNREEILKLLPVIEDYAAKTGKDLVSTAQAFSYAIQYGSTRSLRAFGVEVDKTGSQLDVFNELVKLGDGNTKGLAEKIGAIGSGPLISVRNQLDELAESFGERLIPQQQHFAEVLETAIIPAIQSLIPLVGMWSAGFTQLFEQWAKGLQPVIEGIEKILGFMARMDLKPRDLLLMSLGPLGWGYMGAKAVMAMGGEGEPAIPGYTGPGTSGPRAGGNYVRGAYQGSVDALFAGRESALSTTARGGESAGSILTAAITGQLAQASESIRNQIDELDAAYKKGELGVTHYYRNVIALTNVRYDTEKAALEEQLKVADKQEARTKIRGDIELLELKRTGDINRLKNKADEDQLKQEQDVEKRRQDLVDARIKSMEEMAGIMQDIGKAIGESIVTGFSQSVEGVKDVFKQIISTIISFLENYVLTVKLKVWLDEMFKSGWVGALKAGLITGAITAAFESMKAMVVGKMEQGGPVVGPRHSAGGVNVEMEGGEYVHPRSAVSYYGGQIMEAMRRMVVPREVFAPHLGLSVASAGGFAQAGGMVTSGRGSLPPIVNFVDKSLLDRYLNSAAGQRAIVNVIRKNQLNINRG